MNDLWASCLNLYPPDIKIMPDHMFSIITPCFNAEKYIEEAIESVLNQHEVMVEHIIVDGGSNDGTLEIIKKYSHLRVISEPDNGMYDAINKGLEMAQGEYIGLLNSDDLYPAGSLKQAFDAFVKNPGVQAVNGGFEVFEGDAEQRQIVRISPAIGADEFWFRIVQGSTAPNTWFLHRSIFERFGKYDDRYRVASDREFIMRLALAGIRPLSLPGVNYHFRQHAGSATFSLQDSRHLVRGQLRMRTAQEAMNIEEEYLAKRNLPSEMRKALLHSHTVSTYRLAATALYHRKWKSFAWGAWHGWRYNIFWPVIFFISLFRRIQKEIGFNA
jgi:glycosyltransferase involved in cell wall biosynthesis